MIKKTVYKKHLGYKTSVLSSSMDPFCIQNNGAVIKEMTVTYHYSDEEYISTQSDRMWFKYKLRTGG